MSGKDKRMGDVICVKLSEHAEWGSLEMRVHQPVPWLDYDLEQQMRSLIVANIDTPGYAPPAIITPYKLSEPTEIKNDNGKTISLVDVTLTRSLKYLDFGQIKSEELRNKMISNEFVVFPEELDPQEIMSAAKNKTNQEVSNEFEENKIYAKRALEARLPSAQSSYAFDRTEKIRQTALQKVQSQLDDKGQATWKVPGVPIYNEQMLRILRSQLQRQPMGGVTELTPPEDWVEDLLSYQHLLPMEHDENYGDELLFLSRKISQMGIPTTIVEVPDIKTPERTHRYIVRLDQVDKGPVIMDIDKVKEIIYTDFSSVED